MDTLWKQMSLVTRTASARLMVAAVSVAITIAIPSATTIMNAALGDRITLPHHHPRFDDASNV